jgi:hypothetical protein
MRASSKSNNSSSSRAKISKTLKEKWQDPEFRERMIKSMKQNRKKASPASVSQRQKISDAMKKKWQNAEYRAKTLKGMEAYREAQPPKPKKMVSKAASTIKLDDVFAVAPMKKGAKKKRKRKVTVGSTNAAKKKKKTKKKKKKATAASAVKLATTAKVMKSGIEKKPKNGKGKAKLKDDGDISRMREERRDLYDLLYGDEGGASSSEEDEEEELTFDPLLPDPSTDPENAALQYFAGSADLDDENLDDFDPYGLDDC